MRKLRRQSKRLESGFGPRPSISPPFMVRLSLAIITSLLTQASGWADDTPGTFVTIPEDRLTALKAASTPEEWAALMPEATPHNKTIGDRDLPLYVFPAQNVPSGTTPPGLLLFSGGAFETGEPHSLYRQALDYSRRGITVALPKYRGTKSDDTPVIDAYRDGRDAVAWVRGHASELGIDPHKILAGGSSAGANLALALATLDFLHQEIKSDDARPDGLLLYDVGGGASAMAPIDGDPFLGSEPAARWNWYTPERFGGDPRELSPFHHLHDHLPPASIFIGGREKAATRHGAWLLWTTATDLGAKWDFHVFADMPHASMVNSATWQPDVYRSVIETTDRWLHRHGFLPPNE